MELPSVTQMSLETLPVTADVWLRPLGWLSGVAAREAVADGRASNLAGTGRAFGEVEILCRSQDGSILSALAPVSRVREWTPGAPRLAALGAAPPAWAGLSLARPRIMGILNVTPDSFFDRGAFLEPAAAIARGRALMAAGADVIDVGGESTRPGAAPVAPDEELRRVEPVVRALAGEGALVSIDTRRAAVMAAALAAGARIVNDVTALTGDTESLALVARSNAAVVLMHMRGEPRTMQAAPSYSLASLEVAEYLAARVAACRAAGIPLDRIVVDPGLGFGKRPAHNLEILARLGMLHGIGCGVLVGFSRKSTIARVSAGEPAEARLPGSLAGALAALESGAQILRVHDVAQTRQAIAVRQAIEDAA